MTSGTLPTGLTLSTGGLLSGTPTTGGNFVFTITATDASTGVGPSRTSQTYQVIIAPGPINPVVNTTVPVAAGSYNSITVNSGGLGILTGDVTVNSFVTINSGGGINDGCYTISGTGSFTLVAGGSLAICDAYGLQAVGNLGAVRVTGARSFSTDASYIYNGST